MKKTTKDMFLKAVLLVALIATGIALGMGSSAYAEKKSVSGNSVSGDNVSGDNVSGDDATENIKNITVSNFKVDDKFHLCYTVNNPDQKPAFYHLTLEEYNIDHEYVTTWDFAINPLVNSHFQENSTPYNYNEYHGINVNESGKYRFCLYIAENEDDKNGKTFYSDIIDYVKPSSKVSAPTGLRWERDSKGGLKACWNLPDSTENIYCYTIDLYDRNNTPIVGNYAYGNKNFTDFNDVIGVKGKAPYRFTVRALSADITLNAHSDCVESDYYDMEGIINDVNNKLDPVSKDLDVTKEDIEKIKNTINQGDLQISMQSSQDTLDKISTIEGNYNNNDLTINDNDKVFDGNIKVVGAKLNADKNVQVSLNVKEAKTAEATDQVTEYLKDNGLTSNNTLSFDMKLDGEGVPEDGSLDIPVSITLPIPDGWDVNKLRVVHFSTKDSRPVIYKAPYLKINGDGTFTFTINHFSLFSIVELNENETVIPGPAPQPVNPVIPNAESNAEVIIVDSNGNTVAEPAGWVPTTPDEIKRYAFIGKEPVVFANAEGNPYPVKVYNSIQGPKCFVSFEAVLGDYTMARTYNIYPNNKQTYAMDKKAKITIEIPKLLQQKGRTFKMICVTEGGTPIVLNDLDKNPNTITFETDKYYAFALIYK